MDKELTSQDLNLLLNGMDAALDFMEQLEDDQLESIYDAYEKIHEARDILYAQEVECFRAHLERSFAA